MNTEPWLHKYQALNTRERSLLLLCVLVVTYMLCNSLLFVPMDQTQLELQQQREKQQAEIKLQMGLQRLYSEGLKTDPDALKKRQLDALRQRLASLDASLTQLSVGMVAAQQLPQLLKDVVSRSGSLQLSQVETLPIAPVSLAAANQATDSVGSTDGASVTEQGAGVFKHSVRVTLEGTFFPVVEYLQSLEALPWRLFWEQLSYEVDDYPEARVQFVVYTLSTEEGLFSAQ